MDGMAGREHVTPDWVAVMRAELGRPAWDRMQARLLFKKRDVDSIGARVDDRFAMTSPPIASAHDLSSTFLHDAQEKQLPPSSALSISSKGLAEFRSRRRRGPWKIR